MAKCSFEKYVSFVKDNIIGALGYDNEEYQAVVEEITKLNGKYLGITVRKKNEEEQGYNPTINLNSEYLEYEAGGTLQESIMRIACQIREFETRMFSFVEKEDGMFNGVEDYKEAKPRLFLEILNYDRNKEYIGEVLHKRLLDLVIIPKIRFHETKDGILCGGITNRMLDLYGKTLEEVIEDALSLNIECNVQDITEILKNLTGRDYDTPVIKNIGKMYVATTGIANGGASAILYKNCKDKLREKLGNNFYIIPSSVHEIIAVKAKEDDAFKLADIIKKVNNSIVDEAERLSNSLYFYDAGEDELSIAIKGSSIED